MIHEGSMWWQSIDLDAGRTGCWRAAAMNLSITHEDGEWIVQHQWEDQLLQDWRFETVQSPPCLQERARFLASLKTNKLNLEPCLADRSIVAIPKTPFYILKGDRTVLYISSPVWLSISIGEQRHLLQQIPLQLSSDTWFGPSTITGELCYASRTSGSTSVTADLLRPYRALTPVSIINKSDRALLLEHINIPVPYLSTYMNDDFIWTEALSIVTDEDSKEGSMTINKGPPKEAKLSKRMAMPRKTADKNVFVKALDMLF
jgi:hypothetical protein